MKLTKPKTRKHENMELWTDCFVIVYDREKVDRAGWTLMNLDKVK